MFKLINTTSERIVLYSKDVHTKIYSIEPCSTPIVLTRSKPRLKVFTGKMCRKISVVTGSIPDGYSDPDNLLSGNKPLLVTRDVALYIRYFHPEFSNIELYVASGVVKDGTQVMWYTKLCLF